MTFSGLALSQLPVPIVSALSDFAPYRVIKSATTSLAAAVPLLAFAARLAGVFGGSWADVVLALVPTVLCGGLGSVTAGVWLLLPWLWKGPQAHGPRRKLARQPWLPRSSGGSLVSCLPDWGVWELAVLGPRQAPPGRAAPAEGLFLFRITEVTRGDTEGSRAHRTVATFLLHACIFRTGVCTLVGFSLTF